MVKNRISDSRVPRKVKNSSFSHILRVNSILNVNKKLLLVLLSLAIGSTILGFGTAKALAPRTHIIKLTKVGFEPDLLVISRGDSIMWVNTGVRERWPASSFHPTHSQYPVKGGCIGSKLDACQGLKKGESYTFKFDKMGVFGMHDHLFPGDTMVIKVVNKTSYLLNLKGEKASLASDNITSSEPSKFRNLSYAEQRVLIKNLAKKDPNYAWEYLKKGAMENGEVVVSSHEFAHIIGREIYKKYGFEGIKTCSKLFSYGCFHGVTEQMLLTAGKSSMPFIEKECLRLYPATLDQKTRDPGCIHGIGHGLVSWNGLNIRAALEDCDSLREDVRKECWDGAFMEYSASNVSMFTPKDPWKFCRELASSYQKKCALYIGFMYIKSVPFDTSTYSAMCVKAPQAQLATTCVRWIGFMTAENSKGSFDYIKNECAKIKKNELVATCLIGAAQETAVQKYLDWKTLISSICSTVPKEYIVSCNDYDN